MYKVIEKCYNKIKKNIKKEDREKVKVAAQKTSQSAGEGHEIAFRYLMWIGMINALIAVIKVFERLPGSFNEEYVKVITKILSFAEPYGKVAASALVLLICQMIFKKKYPDKQPVLLHIWGLVFVGIQIYYYIEVNFYEKTLEEYFNVASSSAAYNAFYASTHGFKYTPLFVGIMFGFMMTGIMLKDRLVEVLVILICVVYLLLFGFTDMLQLSFKDTNVGIVLSSAFFHALQTAGVFLLGMYLEIKYVKN